MPRFFFDYHSDGNLDRDDEGLDFPNLETAYREAVRGAVDLWIEAVRERRYPGAHSLVIRDTNDQVLKVVPLTSIFGDKHAGEVDVAHGAIEVRQVAPTEA